MKKIKITLPDNSIKEVDHGSTPSDVALQIGPGLARSVVVAKANNVLVDLNIPLTEDCNLQLFNGETEEGHDTLLHSTAHLMAQAVKEIYPNAKNIFKAVSKTHLRCDGAYAVIALITGHGLIAFRDNNGIRPLSIGVRKGKTRDEYILASEDALFSSLTC